jgi:hypothetical protein
MRKVLFLPVLGAVVACLASSCYALLLWTVPWFGDTEVVVEVSDLSQPITIGIAPFGDREYAWGVQVDSDDNVLTGDASGFDVEIVLESRSNGVLQTGTVDHFCSSAGDWSVNSAVCIWRGASFEPEAVKSAAYLDGERIRLYFQSGNLSRFVEGFRCRFFSYYSNPPVGPPESDDVSELRNNGSSSDPSGDVTSAILDIVSAAIDYPSDR